MITILNRPYDGLTPKISPVYNGLAFVVNSDKRLIPNFRYVAEIYVNNGKIGELRHNPDITSNNYGIFDVGRVIENYISFDFGLTTLQSQNYSSNPNSLVNYYVRFGEEYSRVGGLVSIYNSGPSYGNKIRITTSYPHNLQTGNRVLLQGTSVTSYNTYSNVIRLNSTQFIMSDIPYTSSPNVSSAYFISGETITGWSQYTGADGAYYLQLKVGANSSLNVGDVINIRQDRKNTSGTTVAVVNTNYENTDWTITSKLSYSTYTYLRTTIPYGSAVATNIYGSVISRSNFVLYNLISTQNDGSSALNSVAQYDTFLNYSLSNYIFTNNTNKYLSQNPTKEIDLCPTDYFTLTFFGSNQIRTIDPVNYTRRTRVETWSTPTGGPHTSTGKMSDSSIIAGRLCLIFGGVNLTSYLTPGSYVTLSNYIGDTTILNTTYSSGNTYCILNKAYNGLYPSIITLTVNIQVRYYDMLFPSGMSTVGVGPANLNLCSEIANGSCYKYFVYPIKWAPNQFITSKIGETWTFNLNCNCKEKVGVMWLNELGAFDYFFFDGRTDKVRTIEKQNWRRHLKSYKSGSGYKYSMGDRGLSTYNTKSVDEWTVRSRFLTQDELDWLSYIYESPEVYIIKNGKPYPITITNDAVNLYSKANVGDMGRLYYYTINFKMSNDRVVQRGGKI